jgi:hypothetical protein
MTRPRPRFSLAGTTATASAPRDGCTVCDNLGAPALLLLRHMPGHDYKASARLCLPCVGRAVEQATGWRVMRAWSQWLASSKVGQAMRLATDNINEGEPLA